MEKIILLALLSLSPIKAECIYNGEDYLYQMDVHRYICKYMSSGDLIDDVNEVAPHHYALYYFIQNSDLSNITDLSFTSYILDKIKILHIYECKIGSEIQILNQLHYLSELSIYGNSLNSFDGALLSNTANYLQVLNLTNNNLTRVYRLCTSVSTLSKVVFQNNKLSKIEDQFFNNCSYLTYIDLSENILETIPDDLFDLKKIHEIILRNNLLRAFNLNSRNVRKIDISYNKILSFTTQAFCNLPYLEFLDLSHTIITIFDSSNTPDATAFHIQTLFLNGNNISTLKENTFRNFDDLITLDLSDNSYEYLKSSSISEPTPHASLVPKIRQANSVHTMLNLHIGNGILNGLTNLQNLVATNNKIRSIGCEISTTDLINVNSIHMANNIISDISICAFKIFPHLTDLQLPFNNLSYLRIGTLSPLSYLKCFNISFNKFKHLDEKVLYPATNLITFDVSGNFLIDFDPHILISHLSSLKYIGLTGNPWLCHTLNLVLNYLRQENIKCIPGVLPDYVGQNINGIPCFDKFEITGNKSMINSAPNRSNVDLIEFNKTDFIHKNLMESSVALQTISKHLETIENNSIILTRLINSTIHNKSSQSYLISEDSKLFNLLLIVFIGYLCLQASKCFYKNRFVKFKFKRNFCNRSTSHSTGIELLDPETI